MKLSDEQQRKFLEKLNGFQKSPDCAICGKNDWSLNDAIFEYREFQGGNLVLGPEQSVFPVVLITCNNCGNTHTLNAIRLGILDPQKAKDQK